MLLNKERMLQKMDEFNLDVIIASHPENVSYMADFQSQLPYMYRFLNVESFALFPRRSDIAPALIVSKGDIAWAARYPTWMPEVYTFGNSFYVVHAEETMSEGEKKFKQMLDNRNKHAHSAGEVIVKALKQKGLDRGRIGLDEKNLYPATKEEILQGLPHATFLDAFELIRVVRMVKTPEELERIKEAGLLNERAVQSVLNRLAAGVPEEDLTQHFLEFTAKEGAVFEFWNTASGTQSSMTIMSNGHHHPRAQYRLKKGDMFRYDGGSIFNRYHSDAGGCAVLGNPADKHKACYRGIEAGMERAIELLRPGAIPSKLFEEVMKAVEKAGVKDYSKLAHFCGHGIGIEARDYPIFTRPVKASSPFLPGTYDLPVEEGMVISIEVPYAELGLGGFQVEYTLLVKKEGCAKLYPHERELVVR
ncbi:MAG: Xaa-Pro peptidase family protein [Deltaproteobacteria bacterium]|nr:Xaa-Pro peptidase family protein [Deltaproteobacteria bacterium]